MEKTWKRKKKEMLQSQITVSVRLQHFMLPGDACLVCYMEPVSILPSDVLVKLMLM